MTDDPSHALRLTFEWRGAQISLVGGERVAMIVPASAPEPPDADTTGYSFSLLDANGNVIYRRPLHGPLRIDTEAYAPGRGRAIERVPLAPTEGQFTVLVPDLANARTFRLSGPPDPRRSGDRASELIRLDVDAFRKASVSRTPAGTPRRPGSTG